MQTFEKAQIDVHHLGLSVTVQYSMERRQFYRSENYAKTVDIPLSGKKPRLTKSGKTITFRTDNHVPLVVPGLSTSSGSSTSSKSPLRDQFSTDLSEEQRDVGATGDGQHSNKSNTDDRLQGLLEWSEPFTDNPEDTETYASAQVCQDSDSERAAKVAQRLGKHNIFTHLLNCRDWDVCLRTKLTTAPCRRRTGEALPRAKKFGDLVQLITES